MQTLQPHYSTPIVLASVVVAVLTTYLALALSRTVRLHQHRQAVVWQVGGALALGTGLWSSHFASMLAMSLPIPIGYDPLHMLLAWIAAITVARLVLHVARHNPRHWWSWGASAAIIAAGLCGMQYLGMASVRVAPAMIWHPWLVMTSMLLAATAGAGLLLAMAQLRRLDGLQAWLARAVAALAIGIALGDLHYTGMSSASFPANAVCLSINGVSGRHLDIMVVAGAMLLVSFTLLTLALDARLRAHSAALHVARTELERLAFRDPLTGLANRALLTDRLEHALDLIDLRNLRENAGPSPRLAVLFIDLDAFQPINDSFGHEVGDEVLRQFAQRLETTAQSTDTAARIGSDEFVVMLDEMTDPTHAAATAERILQAMHEPFRLPARKITLSCSIGIAFHPDDDAREQLVKAADIAMRAAKRNGGGTYALFDPAMWAPGTDLIDLQQDLRSAITRNELQLHYQPEVDARSGRVLRLEALLRWRHPIRGFVSPDVFVALAERSGLIAQIGEWVLDEACRQLAEWRQQGWTMSVAVNLSACQFRHGDLPARIRAHLLKHGVDPQQLQLEITETAAMGDALHSQHMIAELAALGLEMAIDDFGTGYSSLAYLRRLRVQQLKIDASFVRDLDFCVDARAIISAVVQLAHSLGLGVVAEGVETPTQHEMLLELGCDCLQGYRFGRPMPATAYPCSSHIIVNQPDARPLSIHRSSIDADSLSA